MFEIGNFKLTPDCQFSPPSDIKNFNNKFYLLDEFNHRVLIFDIDGTQSMVLGKKGRVPGDFLYPKGIAMDSEENIFITDCWNHRIQKFSPDGKVLACFGKYGKGVGELNEPFGITIDKNNWIYIVEKCNHRIHIFDSNCKPQGFFGARGNIIEEERANFFGTKEEIFYNHPFEFPTTIAISSRGDIFVVDSGNHRVQKFSALGDFLGSFGNRGEKEGEFQHPYGIVIDHNDKIFVSDFNNNRVQVFTYDGDFLSSFKAINFPTALCMKDESAIMVAAGFAIDLKLVTTQDIKLEELYQKNISSNDKDKNSYYRLGKIYKKEGKSEAEELIRKAFTLVADDINIEDVNDDEISRDILHIVLKTNLPSLDIDLINKILIYFNIKIGEIEKKIFLIKNELIEITEQTLKKRLIIENATLKGVIPDFQHEKDEMKFIVKEREIKNELNNFFHIYKKTTLKRNETTNVLSDYCLKTNNSSYIKNIILKDSFQQFFTTCHILKNLLEEKDRVEKEAEGYFRDSERSNEENWNGFQIAIGKLTAIDQFLESLLIVSKIFLNRVNTLLSFLSDKEILVLFETGYNFEGLKKTFLKVFRYFNNNWDFFYYEFFVIVRKEVDIVEEVINFISKPVIKSIILKDIKEHILESSEQFLSNLKKDDYLTEKLFIQMITNGYQSLKKGSEESEEKLFFTEIESIIKKIEEKIIEGELTITEIVKLEKIKEAGAADNQKTIIVSRKLLLCWFKYRLLKKEITRVFNLYEVIIYNLYEIYKLKLDTNIGNNLKNIEPLKEECNCFINKFYKTCKVLTCKINKIKKQERELIENNNEFIADEFTLNSFLLTFLRTIQKKYEVINSYIYKIKNLSKDKNESKSYPLIKFDKIFAHFADPDREIVTPSGMAIDKDGNCYILEHLNYRIKKISIDGKFISNFGSFGNLPGKFITPYGIAINKTKNILYVCDITNHRIQKFSPDGNFIGSFGEFGCAPGYFNNPSRIAIDNEGNIYIVEYGNHRVQKFDSNENFIMSFGKKGDGVGMLNKPKGIAVLNNGNILICEVTNKRLQLFDKYGRSLKIINDSEADIYNWMNFYSDIAMDEDENIYVVRFFPPCIQIFNYNLALKKTIEKYDFDDITLSSIGSIAIHEDNLLISDYLNSHIYRYKIPAI